MDNVSKTWIPVRTNVKNSSWAPTHICRQPVWNFLTKLVLVGWQRKRDKVRVMVGKLFAIWRNWKSLVSQSFKKCIKEECTGWQNRDPRRPKLEMCCSIMKTSSAGPQYQKKRKKTNQQNLTNFLKFDIKMTIDNSTEIDQPKSGNILSSNEQSIYCG